jgi:hypothetical protein
MIRLTAAIMCAVAARRWPRLWFVVVALLADHGASAMVMHAGELAPIVWASSSIVASSAGSSFGTSPRRTSSIVAAIHASIAMFMPSQAWHAALVCGSSWLAYMAILVRATPRKADECIIAVLLAGNATTAALSLIVGIDRAYESGVVGASNHVVHAVIVGLALCATQSR